MSRKVFPILLIIVFLCSSCLYGNIVDNKYTTTGVGNLTPVKSIYYYVGSPTYTWAGGYFANLTTNNLNLYNTNTQISRDGAGNMIFTDAVSGTNTLASLVGGGGGGGGNVTGSGTSGRMTMWNGTYSITDATNTDAQVSAAVTASHAQNTDTALGVQGADLNMGGNDITNVATVDGVDISTLGTGNVTGGGAPTRLAYWDGATSIGDTNIYFDVPLGYYGVGNTTPSQTWSVYGTTYLAGDVYTDRWISSDQNTFLGVNVAGNDDLAAGGTGNTAVGYRSVYDITSGFDNTAIGSDALTNVLDGYYNTAVGADALNDVTSGSSNTGVGSLAGGSITTGQFNTAVGTQSLLTNNGDYNTALGQWAGANNTGNNNLFLGFSAGQDSLAVSNKLYVDNSNTATPLIYGDFNTNNLTVYGVLSSAGNKVIDVATPTANTDAANKLYVDTAVAGGTGGSGNITGAGTNGYITMWSGSSNITNATNTDIQVAAAVNAAHVQNTDTGLAAVGTKNPPIDADKALYRDSTAGDALVTSTWAQIKAFLKTYFDTLYGAGAGNVTAQGKVDYIPQFSTTTNITNSIMSGNSTYIVVNGGIAPTGNITMSAGMTVDGVDISTLSAGSGNVTYTQATADYLPKWSPAGNLVNSTISSNVTFAYVSGNLVTSGNITATNIPLSINTIAINFVIDGGGSAITTGIKGDLEIPFNCTIDRATALADTTGNVTVSIWKDTYANFPPLVADNITALAPVSIIASNKSQDSTLTGWTKTITAGDILRFNVDLCAVITRVTISLKATRN